jgi:hypothetical protein
MSLSEIGLSFITNIIRKVKYSFEDFAAEFGPGGGKRRILWILARAVL